MLAIKYRLEFIAHMLLDIYGRDCLVNYINSESYTALLYACRYDYYELVNRIIFEHYDNCCLDHKPEIGNDALYHICYAGYDKFIYKLIDIYDSKFIEKYDIINRMIRYSCDEILFHIIEKYNDKYLINNNHILYNLIAHKMKKSALKVIYDYKHLYKPDYTYSGRTLIIEACYKNQTDIALALINTFGNQCALNKISDYQKRAIYYALSNNCLKKVVKRLIHSNDLIYIDSKNCPSDKEILVQLCYNNLIDEALIFIDKYPHKCDNDQKILTKTPLIFACMHGSVELATKILDVFGMDSKPGFINHKNESALAYACKNNMNTIVDTIINKFSSNLNVYDEIHTIAQYSNSISVINRLLNLNVLFDENILKVMQIIWPDDTIINILEKVGSISDSSIIEDLMVKYINREKVLSKLKEHYNRIFGEYVWTQKLEVIRDIIQTKHITHINCKICFSDIINLYSIEPCHHCSICYQCIQKIKELNNKCPICRTEIEKIHKLYV